MIIKKLCFITFLFFGINANSSVLIETNTQNFENTADDCSLNWVYKLENYEKEVILDFFERIFNSLIKNDAIPYLVIEHTLTIWLPSPDSKRTS